MGDLRGFLVLVENNDLRGPENTVVQCPFCGAEVTVEVAERVRAVKEEVQETRTRTKTRYVPLRDHPDEGVE